jgi:carbonic anhydrase/acetyltransferase-like protein (isoleucine patch superfamily)
MNRISKHAFLGPRVKLGDNIIIFPFASIRADEGSIEIGDNTNIQDNCVVHGPGVKIGNNVTIGHGAVVHCSKVGNNVVIGMNATVLEGAEIGDWCIIAAGTVVKENERIPSNSLVVGVPSRIVRQLTEKDRTYITHAWKLYVERDWAY